MDNAALNEDASNRSEQKQHVCFSWMHGGILKAQKITHTKVRKEFEQKKKQLLEL